jgi:hypothetical protein
MARYNTIYAGPVSNPTPHAMEALTSVALTPGSLVTFDAANGFTPATAATTAKVWLVQDNYLTGRGIDTSWAAGSRAVALDMVDGQLFNALVATGNDLTEGDALTPGAGGVLVKAALSDKVVAVANETFNNNTGSAQLVSVRAATGYLTAAT